MSKVEVTTKSCNWCGKKSKLTVDKADHAKWKSGTHVQTAFPTMSSNDRELLVSGTHPKCWDEMFPDD